MLLCASFPAQIDYLKKNKILSGRPQNKGFEPMGWAQEKLLARQGGLKRGRDEAEQTDEDKDDDNEEVERVYKEYDEIEDEMSHHDAAYKKRNHGMMSGNKSHG